MSIPDHPVIQNMMRNGQPDGKEPEFPICPACGDECDIVYRDRYGRYIGCSGCITVKDAWEVPICFPREEE